MDFRGRDGNTILLLQDLVGTDWQAIDTNEIVLCPSIGHTLLKELLDSLCLGDFNRIRKATTIVIHVEYLHELLLSKSGEL